MWAYLSLSTDYHFLDVQLLVIYPVFMKTIMGNWIEKTDGAVFLSFFGEPGDEVTIYYSHEIAIAIMVGSDLYRLAHSKNPIIMKRLRTLMMRHGSGRFSMTDQDDLNRMVDSMLIATARKLIDLRLAGK